MKRSVPAFVLTCAPTALGRAQAPSRAAGEYKLGTFEKDRRTLIGVIVSDDEDSTSMPSLWERKTGDTRHNPYFFFSNIGTLTDPVEGSAASSSAAAT
jgi:hypothetical protein